MNITSIEVAPIDNLTGKMRAFVRVLLDDELQLTGLRIYQGSAGLFVAYPNNPDLTHEDYRQAFYPVTKELRDKVELAVLAQYKKVLEEAIMTKGGPMRNLHGQYADVAKEMIERGSDSLLEEAV